MSIDTNPVLAGLVAHFNNDENMALANRSRELVAILSPEKTTGSAYSFFYGREENDDETNALIEKYQQAEEALRRIKASLEEKRATVSSGSDMSQEDAKAELDSIQGELKEFNSTRRQMIKTAEMLGITEDEKKEFEEALVSAGKAKRAGGGSGQRIRWENLTVNGESVKNFTEAAKLVKGATTADLTNALLKAYASSEWTAIRDNDPNVEFTVTDKDGKAFEFVGELAEAKDAPAPKSDAENADDDAEVEPTDADIEDIDNEDEDPFNV